MERRLPSTAVTSVKPDPSILVLLGVDEYHAFSGEGPALLIVLLNVFGLSQTIPVTRHPFC